MDGNSKSVKRIYNWGLLVIVVVAVVLINIIGQLVRARVDMTEDQRYSLNKGTVSYLQNDKVFKNRLLLKIYLDGNLPAELQRFRNAIEDKLKEFKLYAGDRIEYEFINPDEGSQTDQDFLKEQLYDKGKGIMPMEIVYSKEGDQTQKLVWPGAIIEYGGSTRNIAQLLPGTPQGNPFPIDVNFNNLIQNSINNLEYMLISSIRRATLVEKPRIAFIQGHGELSEKNTQRARTLISPYYTVEDITLNDSLDALKNVKGVVIAGPRGAYSNKDMYLLDQFVMGGGRMMCFLDKLTFPADTLDMTGVVHTTRLSTGLDRMLFDYGIKINDNYVADVRCGPKFVPMGQENLMPWFFYVAATPTKHPMAGKLEPVMLRYASEIEFTNVQAGTSSKRMTPILTSSTNSTVTGMAPLVSLGMPRNFGKVPVLTPNPTDEANKHCLAAMVEGEFESHFKNRIAGEFANNPETRFKVKSTKPGKVFVVGNGDFIANIYDSMPGKNGQMMYRPSQFNNLRYDIDMARAQIQPLVYGNQEFFQNMVDYMMGNAWILELRSKQIDIHPIDKEKVKADSGFYKLINLGLPSGIILLLALALFYLRKRRYTRS